MSQANIITFGAHNLPCWSGYPEKQREKTAVDVLRGTWVTERGVQLRPGDAVPGYPGMIIFGLGERDTGGCVQWRIDAQGSLDGSNPTKYISRGRQQTLDEGWDVRTLSALTWDLALLPVGSAHPDHPHMFVYDRSTEDEVTDWTRVQVTYKGIEEDKPVRRRVNGRAEQVDSTFTGLQILGGTMFSGFPPLAVGSATLSGTDLSVSYSRPGTVVSDTLVSLTPPPTEMLGQFYSPANAPTVSFLTLPSTSVRYHFPFGWRLSNLSSEQFPGKDMWLMTLEWEYQPATTPASS